MHEDKGPLRAEPEGAAAAARLGISLRRIVGDSINSRGRGRS
jgi:hypothetical protein